MFKTQGIDHVGLSVEDPEKSAAWYMRLLGLERRFEEDWGDRPMVVSAGDTSLAYFDLGDGAASPGIGASSVHIAFRVDRENFARARGVFEKEGLAVREEDYRVSRSLHVQDPDGLHLEITTYEVDEPD